MAGRPTDYKEEYNAQAEKLCKLGATDKELADFFEVVESTINEWKLKHPEFSESIKAGKILADSEVAEKLFKRATGYSHEDVDIKVIDGQIVTTDLVKHYPPDTTAAIFWLKNRQKEKWRDKTENDLRFPDGVQVVMKKVDSVKPEYETK
jgi:hypothetical protein